MSDTHSPHSRTLFALIRHRLTSFPLRQEISDHIACHADPALLGKATGSVRTLPVLGVA
jgi:hypothetical protein